MYDWQKFIIDGRQGFKTPENVTGIALIKNPFFINSKMAYQTFLCLPRRKMIFFKNFFVRERSNMISRHEGGGRKLSKKRDNNYKSHVRMG